jgi:MFS family permease
VREAPQATAPRLLTWPFATLWIVAFGSFGSVYLVLSTLPLYLHGWGVSPAGIGIVVALMSGAAFFGRPFLGGWLAEGLGRRPLLLVGVAALFLSTLGLPVAGGVGAVAALRFFNGVGWSSVTANASTLASEMSPPHRRGEALGLFGMAQSVALAGGPAFGLYLAGRFGYPAAFWSAVALAGLGLAATLALRAPRVERRPLEAPRLHTLLSRDAVGPAALLVLHAFMYGGLITFLPLLATERRLGNPGLFFAVYAAALLVLRGVAGRLSDRHGRPPVIAPGLVAGTSAMLLLAAAANLVEMLGAALLFAFAMGLVQPAALAWGMDLAAERRATAMATMIMAQDLGIVLGGSLLGVAGTLGGYRVLFGAAAVPGVVALAGLLVAWRAGRLRPRPS